MARLRSNTELLRQVFLDAGYVPVQQSFDGPLAAFAAQANEFGVLLLRPLNVIAVQKL